MVVQMLWRVTQGPCIDSELEVAMASCKRLLQLVMGGTENFLSRLLKDKIPRYHGILPFI